MYKYYGRAHLGGAQFVKVSYKFVKRNNTTRVLFTDDNLQRGIKTFECELPTCRVIKNDGFDEISVRRLINYCRNNGEFLYYKATGVM